MGIGQDPDKVIGDAKFLQASNEVYQLLKGDKNASLTSQQVNDLIDAIVKGCGKQAKKFKITRPPLTGGGGGGGDTPPPYDFSGGGDDVDWAFFLLQLLSRIADQPRPRLP